MAQTQYKVEIVTESGLATLFLGASKLPLRKMEEVMNRYGQEGWEMKFMVVEQHRFLLFWTREAAIITFAKEVN